MSKEKTNELYVAIATQKGGIGKSTITMLLANYLHNIGGKNVGVVDCDDPQHSISDARERELLLIKNNEADKEAAKDVFRKTGKRIFPLSPLIPLTHSTRLRFLSRTRTLTSYCSTCQAPSAVRVC